MYQQIQVSRDCQGQVISQKSTDRTYFVGGPNFTYYLKPRSNQLFQLGLAGYYLDDEPEDPDWESYKGLVLNPYASYDIKWVGGGFGLHLPLDNFDLYDNYRWGMNIYPSAMLRVGPTRYMFADVRYLWDFNWSGMPATVQIGVGSGFNTDNFFLRLGFAEITQESDAFYLSGEYLLGDRLTIKANLAMVNQFHGAIGLQYHFGKNRWTPRYH
jgi:hypothetical protein